MRRLQELRNGFYTAKDTNRSFANHPPILLASAADTVSLGLVHPSRSNEYDLGVFADVVGGVGNRNEVSEHPGYQYDTAGFVLGLDHAFIPGLIGGLDVGYVFSGIDYKDVGDSRGRVDTLHGGIYGTRFFKHWHIDAALSGGYNWYESGRRIVFGAVNRTAEADFSGWLLDAHLGGGYDFEPGGFIITPQAAIDYALLHTNGYTEHGAGALDLDVDAVDTHSLATSLGATMAYPFEMIANVTLVPSISAAWQHEFLGDKDDNRTYLIGAPSGAFFIDTAGPDPDSALIGVALLLQGEQVSFDMRYDAKLSSHLDAHHFNAELRYVF
jgi:outer membrane autotransporter protein